MMKNSLILSFLVFFLMTKDSNEYPEPRNHHAMVFDASRNRTVLYGDNGDDVDFFPIPGSGMEDPG